MMKRNLSSRTSKWKYAAVIPLSIFSFLIFSCNDSNQSLPTTGSSNESEIPMEITITEDLTYRVGSQTYQLSDMEKLLREYQDTTLDPRVNVRAANFSDLTVGDISELGSIALRLHLRMEFYTKN